MQNGSPRITDGPFGETKEQLAGYYITECANLDDGIEWAAKIPAACRGHEGCIEIRPMPGLPRGMADIRTAAELVFRAQSGRILASLIPISGSFDRAGEALQEAFGSALVSWPGKGIPRIPAAGS